MAVTKEKGKTTLKIISLGYREVGSSSEVEYKKCTGVLKGLTIGQDEAEETKIDGEFSDAPLDIEYKGNPVVVNFELAKYDFETLTQLFGGTYDKGEASTRAESYEGATTAIQTEWEWEISFGKGYKSLVIFKGQTVGTLKKDADGALNYNVKITALVYDDPETEKQLTYKIVGETPTV